MSTQTCRYLFSALAAAAVALALTSVAFMRDVASRSPDAGAARPWEAGLQVSRPFRGGVNIVLRASDW